MIQIGDSIWCSTDTRVVGEEDEDGMGLIKYSLQTLEVPGVLRYPQQIFTEKMAGHRC